MKSTIIFVYVTFPNIKEAKKMSKKLLNKKLIGCANIFPKMESIYIWNDKLNEDMEVAVYFKSHAHLEKKIISFISKHHPYDTPCIAFIKPKSLNKKYAQWLKTNLI